jgi:hypothetical protein
MFYFTSTNQILSWRRAMEREQEKEKEKQAARRALAGLAPTLDPAILLEAAVCWTRTAAGC